MSNTVANTWTKGNKVTAVGTAVNPFNTRSIVMQWNQPVDDSNNDEIVSPIIDIPLNKAKNLMICCNTQALNWGSAAIDIVIYGSSTNSSTLSHWKKLYEPSSLTAATIRAMEDVVIYDLEAKGVMPYMKIGVTPASDIGARDIGFTIFTTEH
tara:strand:+ start:348 stop:806 length:459 start_codon:yes stop_codon:yes gene_type:complete